MWPVAAGYVLENVALSINLKLLSDIQVGIQEQIDYCYKFVRIV